MFCDTDRKIREFVYSRFSIILSVEIICSFFFALGLFYLLAHIHTFPTINRVVGKKYCKIDKTTVGIINSLLAQTYCNIISRPAR